MTDDPMQLLAEFRSEFPSPTADATDAAYARIVGTAGARRSRVPAKRRRRMVLAVAAGMLVFAAASVAAVKEVPWWQNGAPAVDPQQVVSVASDNLPAHVDVEQARTVVTSGDAALVAVPLNATGYCLIPALKGRATLGSQCEFQVTHPASGDDDRSISVIRRAAANAPAAWIVYGRITDPRAAKIDLGAFDLDLAPGGFFLSEVPEGQWSRLSGSATRGAILDGSGGVLRHGCVNWAVSPDKSPTDGDYQVPLWSESSGGTCQAQKAQAPPTVDLSTAKKLFDVTLSQAYSVWKAGETITFEAAQRSDGTSCLVASAQTPQRGVSFTKGCGASNDQTSAAHPINVSTGAGLTHIDGAPVYTWDISGAVDPASKITKLELRSGSQITPVTFGGGFFFAQLPATTPGPRKGTVPMPPGEWLLVGLDSTGAEVARVDLVALQRQSSPH